MLYKERPENFKLRLLTTLKLQYLSFFMLTIDLSIYDTKEMTNQDKIITRICSWNLRVNWLLAYANTFFFDKVTVDFLPVTNSRQS